ncbi:hypothetical protein HZH66_007648 [Vespula vulgaris]|uniref:Uncharacterized protein n=1 Tax=Vespula vulgaris TaxID=7454 RepID=A0A834JYJ9_VESVU|nr:hypothetical protein HZH66_007648 [Vespula vulgaris]
MRIKKQEYQGAPRKTGNGTWSALKAHLAFDRTMLQKCVTERKEKTHRRRKGKPIPRSRVLPDVVSVSTEGVSGKYVPKAAGIPVNCKRVGALILITSTSYTRLRHRGKRGTSAILIISKIPKEKLFTALLEAESGEYPGRWRVDSSMSVRDLERAKRVATGCPPQRKAELESLSCNSVNG